MSAKFEARPKERLKLDPKMHYVRVYKDAARNPSGLSPIGEYLDKGYTVAEEGPAYDTLSIPVAQFNKMHKEDAERFVRMEAELQDAQTRDKDRIKSTVETVTESPAQLTELLTAQGDD